MRRAALLILLLIPALPAAVLAASAAPCTDRLDALAPQVAAIQDAKLKRLAEYDVKRGHRELAEGDEDECTEAADHLDSLLNGR